jgi:hypothetical protein
MFRKPECVAFAVILAISLSRPWPKSFFVSLMP